VRPVIAALALTVLCASPAARAEGPYAPGVEPVASLEAYRRVLADASADPKLDLFTPASRVLRARRPLAADEMRAQAAHLPAPGSRLQVRVLRDRAVVAPALARPATPPVLMQESNGRWRIDLVEMEKALDLDVDGSVLQMDDQTPYAFAIEGRSLAFEDLGSADLFGEDPADAIARLEAAKKSARGELRLAEILLRTCYLVDEAVEHYREALRRAPDDWSIASVYGRRMLFLGRGDEALPVLARFGDRADGLVGRIHVAAGRFREGNERGLRAALRRWQRSAPAAPRSEPDPTAAARGRGI
jgi:tetratricopeptide (TPR) repeat protein